MAESLCCTPETITALLIGYTTIQNKKLKNKIPLLILNIALQIPLTYPSTCSESYVAIGVGSLYLQLSPTFITF